MICGDSLTYMKQMPDRCFDVVLADPPYGEFPLINDSIRESRRIAIGPSFYFMYAEDLCQLDQTPDQVLFWVKTPSTKNTSRRYSRFVEVIAAYDLDDSLFNQDTHWTIRTGIFQDTFSYKQVHPFQKPGGLIEKLLAVNAQPGYTVLDPFSGCGTTEDACERLGLDCLSIEIDPQWKEYYWQ